MLLGISTQENHQAMKQQAWRCNLILELRMLLQSAETKGQLKHAYKRTIHMHTEGQYRHIHCRINIQEDNSNIYILELMMI